jgi:hypothetical protein
MHRGADDLASALEIVKVPLKVFAQVNDGFPG